MHTAPFRILFIEDNEDDARLAQIALEKHAPGEFTIIWVRRLADALAQIRTEHFDAILSDLGLPDSMGLDTVQAIAAHAPALPLVVLTGMSGEDFGREAIRHGANDYLLKGESEGRPIARALRFAIESKRLEIGLRVANEELNRRVTERTRELEIANSALRESERRFSDMLGNVELISMMLDRSGRITFCNDYLLRLTGWRREDVLGSNWFERFIPSGNDEVKGVFAALLNNLPEAWHHDNEILTRSGERRHIQWNNSVLRSSSGDVIGTASIGEDITERKRTENVLRESESRYRSLFENMLNGYAHCRMIYDDADRPVDFVYLDVNKSFERLTGLKNVAGKHVSEVIPGIREVSPELFEAYGRVASTGNPEFFEFDFKSQNQWYTIAVFSPMRGNFVAVFDDITERKRAEEALVRESHRNQVFLRNASDGVHILDTDGNVLEVSDSFCEMLGYSREELIGANVSLWDARWSPQELKQLIAEQIAKKGRSLLGTRHRRRDGSFLDVEVTGHSLELDGKPVLFNSARDITERIRAERQLVETEAQFRGLVEQSIAGIYIIQDGKFVYVNPRFADIFGYASADELIGRDTASLVAEKDRGTVAENLRRRAEGGMASITYDFTGLRKNGSMFDAGVHGSRAIHHGRPAVIGLVLDISEKKRAEEEVRRYVEQLKSAFMSTVEVATIISEMRDPYTAGHERRVAGLAVAIGAELGFDARRQEGLRVAGHLHDIGKITIPAEILSKPGKLSALEFQLIQGHSQASYDVLKGVEWPWPVAQIALQHHERIDGSGYPQGLKGEAILLEARIMAVADVVEAMSSHRPYRPGLGIEKALAEIERGRGTAYDADAADACLRLFREKRYQLPA